jgi:hypothetical protein
MAERSQQPIGNRTPKHSLRVVIGKAIDLFISAMAILLTRGAMVRFFKRRRQVSSRPGQSPGHGSMLTYETNHEPDTKHLRSISAGLPGWQLVS